MKRLELLAASLSVLAATASTAHSQNLVTLYGTFDKSISFLHNQGHKNQWPIVSKNLQGSHWGLYGSEDLDNGIKAIFRIESGFNSSNANSDQSGLAFGRQFYVGLQDDKYGTVTLGRQYMPDTDLLHDLTGGNYLGSVFATPGDVDNYDNSIHVNNSAKYISPTWAGFQFESLYAFGNQVSPFGGSRAWGAAVRHKTGPVSVAASYQHYSGGKVTKGVRECTGVDKTSNKKITESVFNNPVNSNYASAASLKIFRFAGQYIIGPVNFGASYSNSLYISDSFSLFNQTQKYNTGNVFAVYQATPTLLTGIGCSYTKGSGNSSARYNQVSFGADYKLSKQSDLYLVSAWQQATGQKNSMGANAQASIGSYGFYCANSSTQTYVSLGFRHKF